MPIPLLCTVRRCGQPLFAEDRRWACSRGHHFDRARAGYANLLQPQDRRSREPGDTAAALTARRTLHEQGLTMPFLRALESIASQAQPGPVLDVGCGDGFYLGSLAAASGRPASGIDISLRSIEAAARRYPDVLWVVANADRALPYADRTFSLILSITGRVVPAEMQRVLVPGGRLLVAVPAPDDLIEIRGQGRDRTATVAALLAGRFRIVSQQRVTTTAPAHPETLAALRHAIYRPQPRSRGSEAMADPAATGTVTLSLDLVEGETLDGTAN